VIGGLRWRIAASVDAPSTTAEKRSCAERHDEGGTQRSLSLHRGHPRTRRASARPVAAPRAVAQNARIFADYGSAAAACCAIRCRCMTRRPRSPSVRLSTSSSSHPPLLARCGASGRRASG
jgi:hypothetical protein